MAGFLRRAGADLLVDLRLTPRADRDAVDGIRTLADGRQVLAARVRAVPENGRANRAAEALLADVADLPKSAVSVIAGDTARIKTLRLAGAGADVEARLATLAG